jgi:polar amino acid transport system substrate-binding protein
VRVVCAHYEALTHSLKSKGPPGESPERLSESAGGANCLSEHWILPATVHELSSTRKSEMDVQPLAQAEQVMASTGIPRTKPVFRGRCSASARRDSPRAYWALPVLASVLSVASAEAAVSVETSRPLRVVAAPIAPFVLSETDRLTGFSVDIWNAVATRASLQFSWTVLGTTANVLEAVERGDADVGVAAIAITPERERVVDFSHPYLDSGLQIMVRSQNEASFWDTVRAMPWAALTKLLVAAVLIAFLLANVLWLVERRGNPDFKGPYLPAIGESLWGTGEHGERNAPGVVKRITVVGMWLLGVLLIAQLTATVTSSLTVQRLHSDIRGPEDLPGKVVGSVSGTVAGDYLTKRGLPFVDVANADDAIARLLQGDVQAVVFGAPTLQYWVAKRGRGAVQVVGPLFRPERIAIAVSEGSALRKRINAALDELYEDGTYGELYARWFTSAN